ncbi:MFS transporter [Rheinheimera sp. 1928-s]|uniref:MFS transporter n=1 Tax=Rheinheimera sp. 1928-s TaxID=3033803 RepID=UPI0026040F5F|nr:MFS transporter [Rheinheimera sp. 1928-s]MDF3125314.1 MFS transporter [Rheinheimera sp. 1928-s]
MPILFFTVLIDLIGFGMVIPILPFMAPQFGASQFDIAMLIVAYSVCAGLVGGWWGKLSDRLGRKPVIIFCLLVTALSYALLAFATTLVAVYVARVIAGSVAGIYGVASAMVADLSTPEQRAKSMGLIGSAFGLGMVGGPFLGGVLAGDEINFFLPSMVAASLSVLAALLALFKLPESHGRDQRRAHRAWHLETGKVSSIRLLKQTHNLWLIAEFLLHSMVVSTVTYLFPLWMGETWQWGPTEVGIVFGIQGLLMAVLQARLVGVLSRRYGELWVLTGAIVLLILGFVLASLAQQEHWMILSFFLCITGASSCSPVLNSLLSKRTPLEYRGRMMGNASAMGAWGRVCGPLLAGTLLTLSGFSLAWAAGILVGLLFLSWPLYERKGQL